MLQSTGGGVSGKLLQCARMDIQRHATHRFDVLVVIVMCMHNVYSYMHILFLRIMCMYNVYTLIF